MWASASVRSHVEAMSCKLSAEDVLEQYDLKRQEWFIAGHTRWLKQSTGSVHAEARARSDLRGQSRKQFVGTATEAGDCNNEHRALQLLERAGGARGGGRRRRRPRRRPRRGRRL